MFFYYYPPFFHNIVYIIPIAMTDIILLYVAVGELLMKGDKKNFHRHSRNLSLAAMAVALLAYLFAAGFFVAL
jgi:hypothetical protein